MRARKRDEKGEPLEDVEVRLARRIHIWAQTWRRCPKKGCRRTRRCLRFDDCAGVSKEPYWPSEKDRRRYFDPLRAALRRSEGLPAKYDPDERDRNRPLPQRPGRV
ncbi:MAG TPA: hypothetical protein VFK86_01105 [Bauldia sp.]|nr:hypothetical protein [Bauldia sp.]